MTLFPFSFPNGQQPPTPEVDERNEGKAEELDAEVDESVEVKDESMEVKEEVIEIED
jgi:hypothetical protein